MNNSDVIRMAQGTTPTSEIIKKINSSKPDFRLFPDDVRHLRERHVPASVVDAMFARNLRPGGPYYDPQPSGDPGGGGGIIQRQGETLTINEGTPVRLRLTTNLSSAYLRLDDRVHFEVLEDVVVKHSTDSFVVIKRGAPALGTITAVNPTRVMDHHGTVEVAMDYVTLANGDKLAVSGTERGDRHTRPGLLVFLLSPIGYVVQPKDPVWLSPRGNESVLKDGRDFTVSTDGVAVLDSSEFEQR